MFKKIAFSASLVVSLLHPITHAAPASMGMSGGAAAGKNDPSAEAVVKVGLGAFAMGTNANAGAPQHIVYHECRIIHLEVHNHWRVPVGSRRVSVCS